MAVERAKAEGLEFEFHDMLENLQDMRLYLKIRESHPEVFDELRANNKVGVPLFVLPDGSISVDTEVGLEALRKMK